MSSFGTPPGPSVGRAQKPKTQFDPAPLNRFLPQGEEGPMWIAALELHKFCGQRRYVIPVTSPTTGLPETHG